MGTTVLLKNVRTSFPKFFKSQAEQYKGKGAFFCSGHFIFAGDHPQVKEIGAAIRAAVTAKFPGKEEAFLKEAKAKDKLPVHDGDLKADKSWGDAYKGNKYLSARTNVDKDPAPTVFSRYMDPATKLARAITDPNDPDAPYPGCYVNVKLSFYAYNNEGAGVGAAIVGVQKAGDGERLAGGSVAAADDFVAIPEQPAAMEAGAASLFEIM